MKCKKCWLFVFQEWALFLGLIAGILLINCTQTTPPTSGIKKAGPPVPNSPFLLERFILDVDTSSTPLILLPNLENYLFIENTPFNPLPNDLFPRTRQSVDWKTGLTIYEKGNEIWGSHLGDSTEKLIKKVSDQPPYDSLLFPLFAADFHTMVLTSNKILYAQGKKLMVIDTAGDSLQGLWMERAFKPIRKIDSNWVFFFERGSFDILLYDIANNQFRKKVMPYAAWDYKVTTHPKKILNPTSDSIYVYDMETDQFEPPDPYNFPDSQTIVYWDEKILITQKDSIFTRTQNGVSETLNSPYVVNFTLGYHENQFYFLSQTEPNVFNIMFVDFTAHALFQSTNFVRENFFIMGLQLKDKIIHTVEY